MKARKFTAANSRDALKLARAALGEDAVVLSSNRSRDGFELVALAKDDIGELVGRATQHPLSPRRAFAAQPEKKVVSVAEKKEPQPVPVQVPAKPKTEEPGLVEELRALRGMVREQGASLAWMQSAQSRPLRARLLQDLLAAGFGAALARRIAEALPDDYAEEAAGRWVEQALVRNLNCVVTADPASDPFDRGTCALVGPTGVGKTTTAAKLAARCVVKYGAQAIGLVSADHYRIGAQDQLRIYARILGVPVHAVHDAESLRGALAALAGKRLVIVDTTGAGQRDGRVAEQAALLESCGVRRFLLVSAPSQAEALDESAQAFRGPAPLAGAILSKVDEAVLLGGALDVIIRHKLALSHLTSGQRVPEDLHAASAELLVHRALKRRRPPALRLDAAAAALLAMPADAHAERGTRV